MFDTKIALVVRNDLATWQRLNVVAFLATGVASAVPETLGQPYIDANGYEYGLYDTKWWKRHIETHQQV